MHKENNETINDSMDIAIIGMAGRFPKAANIQEFWKKLCQPKPCTTFWSLQELIDAGLSPALAEHPKFVGASLFLEDDDRFDAEFFGLSPAEAYTMDPQIRLMLEVSWSALEHAGYDCLNYDGAIGHFSGMSMSVHLIKLLSDSSNYSMNDVLKFRVVNDKDFLSTRAAYQLNLRGPCLSVQTACSTSLVALHLAVQSLLNGECDMALAGGVTVDGLRQPGYLYEEGAIYSSDGHCRAFDAKSTGTMMGNGIGMVVLKPLSAALDSGDVVHAVIKGTAINNDGGNKLSYTAPGFDAQSQVITEALSVAGVDAETIGYVEAHGTGTPLGDPVEIRALTDAHRCFTQKVGYCAVGSVKTHIGHLDAAAGVAGLIKAVMALKTKTIPANADFEEENPEIDFANSPFYVPRKQAFWEQMEHPRRAAVSAFAVGGTNAHIVLEEAPERGQGGRARSHYPITFSAKSFEALQAQRQQLAEYVYSLLTNDAHSSSENSSQAKSCQQQTLADIAYTLNVGRHEFNYRYSVSSQSLEELAGLLTGSAGSYGQTSDERQSRLVFLFSGQGCQYPQIGMGLYNNEAVYRQCVDEACTLVMTQMNYDIKAIMYADLEQEPKVAETFHHTRNAQLTMFITEYALARLMMSWGLQPDVMLGHSLGEYVVACIAGIFSLQDAIKIVCIRAELMSRMPVGAMLSVPVDPNRLKSMLNDDLWHAVENAPDLQVVSGTLESIAQLEKELTQQGIQTRRLKTSHGFHSGLMDGMLNDFSRALKSIDFNPARIAFIANYNCQTIEVGKTLREDYWVNQLRHTVRFKEGLTAVTSQENGNCTLIEIGPGVLSAIAKMQLEHTTKILSALPTAHSDISDLAQISHTLGELWLNGCSVDWKIYHGFTKRQRMDLPGYPFQGKRFWVDFQTNLGLGASFGEGSSTFTHGEELDQFSPSSASEVSTGFQSERPGVLANLVEPETEIQQQLVDIWKNTLKYQPVGILDNYFDAGGNSLLASSMMSRINQRFSLNLELKTLMDNPCIMQLAESIEAQQWLAEQHVDATGTCVPEGEKNEEREKLEL